MAWRLLSGGLGKLLLLDPASPALVASAHNFLATLTSLAPTSPAPTSPALISPGHALTTLPSESKCILTLMSTEMTHCTNRRGRSGVDC